MEPLTSPLFHHRRKPAILSTSNGLSFSGKDDYGDLLSGGSKKTNFRRGVVVEDYGEIFGGGVAGGGRGSSIPVLDLSDLHRANGLSTGAPMKVSWIIPGFLEDLTEVVLILLPEAYPLMRSYLVKFKHPNATKLNLESQDASERLFENSSVVCWSWGES